MFDRDDPNTETVVEALIDVQRKIGELPHELSMALRRRRGIHKLNLREDKAAQAKGAVVNRPHAVRARKSAPNALAVDHLDRADVLGGARPFRGRDHAWNVEFTHLLLMIGMDLTPQYPRAVNHRRRARRTLKLKKYLLSSPFGRTSD